MACVSPPKSPFEFDDFGESSRLLFGIKQQIYGPLLLTFSTSYNLDNSSNNYGEFENKKLSLGISRRAYSIGAFYNSSNESLGIRFNIFNFDYSGITPSF